MTGSDGTGPRIADVAFICTPDITHYPICSQVSAAGYDVRLEKPITTSLPDCLALLDVRQTHGNCGPIVLTRSSHDLGRVTG